MLENKTLFRYKTSLGQLGIPFKIKEDLSPSTFEIQSDKGVHIAN